jgi:tetratricopeptide (TPR) repeat protein
MRIVGVAVVLAAVLCWTPPLSRAQDAAEAVSAEAQKECDLGRRAKDREERLAHFEKSQELAEQAVTLDDRLAAAHFALFCSLGEQMRIDGETIFSSFFTFPRVMRALDRTLELDPSHLDALSSKGTLLVRLPPILGGDAVKGEQMLQQVLQRDQKAVNARLILAQLYAERGNHAEAIALATEAAKLAEDNRREDLIPEARATLAQLQTVTMQAGLVTP